MSFIEKTLMPGEEIKFRTKLSKSIAIAGTVIYGLLGLLVIAKVPPVGAFFCSIPLVLWLRYFTSEFVVTNRRVLIKVGAVRRRSFEMLLSKIESVRFDQGLSERIFGTGKIVIVGSGGSSEVFKNIATPLEFRRQVQIQIDEAHRGSKTA